MGRCSCLRGQTTLFCKRTGRWLQQLRIVCNRIIRQELGYSLYGEREVFLFINTPLDRIDAHLLNVVSMEGVMKEISHTRNLIIGVNIGFIILVTVIAYVLNAFILKNLRRLTETMKKCVEVRHTRGLRSGAAGKWANSHIISQS